MQANPRMTLFTGSSKVAEKLAEDLKGRIKLEDAGFDWKILGPDVNEVLNPSFSKLSQICLACILIFMQIAPGGRWITLLGFVIKMHMHAVDKSALHSLFSSCMR